MPVVTRRIGLFGWSCAWADSPPAISSAIAVSRAAVPLRASRLASLRANGRTVRAEERSGSKHEQPKRFIFVLRRSLLRLLHCDAIEPAARLEALAELA